MIASIALAALALTNLSAQDKGVWSTLSVPRLCVEPAPSPYLARLVRGQHLVMQGDVLEREPPSQAPLLAVRSLVDWMQEDLRRGPRELRFQPGAPPIFARGAPEDLAAVEKRLTDLDLAAAALEVEVRVWLTPGVGAASTHPSKAESDKALAGAAPFGELRARSGQTLVFGQRSEQSFLGNWSSEVASSSGVAEPRLVRAMLGNTLHVVAARTNGGARVRLIGFLDLAELGAVNALDPMTPELGLIQQPSVHALQVAFGGSIESGGVLAVTIEGAPLAQPNWTLWISAKTQPDASAGSLRIVDLAWLETPALPLPSVHAGGGLDTLSGEEAPNNALVEPFSAASAVQTIEEARARGNSNSVRTPILWAPGLVIVPREDVEAQSELDSLVGAATRSRAAETEVQATSGALRVRAPAVEGAAWRALATTERTLITGYSVEIATETWMPNPKVERVLDGAWAQGQWRAGRFIAAGWSATSEVTAQLSREEARLGRLQLLKRSYRGERVTLDREHPKADIAPTQGTVQGVSLELVAR